MAHRKHTCLSSSGKVEGAMTNYVAFMEKESVHKDFHPLMDFLKSSPVSYALTANPTIYAEIVEEMWSKADWSTKGKIIFTIKGKSYIVTPSVIYEALHLPNSNFESLPTDEEVISMLKCIGYASDSSQLGHISRKYLRKEWSYFFDTLIKVFTGKCSGSEAITRLVLNIAYSLMYNRTIDIGSLLLNEFSSKLGRTKVIYYARFLMIIANHVCKRLYIKNKDDTLSVCLQTKVLFAHLVNRNFNGKVDFVLPRHIQVQLSILSSSPSRPQSQSAGTKANSSVSRNGKRKKTTLPTITSYESISVGGSEEDETEDVANPSQKKMAASTVKPARRLFDVDHEMPPGETKDGVPVVELTSPEEENPKSDLSSLEPALKPNSQEVLPEDHQHLVNAATELKSQLVARLTSSAEKLRTEDMIDLANRCYNALKELGDDYTSFSREVYKLIAQHQKLEFAAKKKDKWNDRDIRERYIKQVVSLSDVTKVLSSAEDKLSRAKTKREELKGALLKLTEELFEEEERVKTLTAETNRCKEAQSDVEVEFEKLVAEKKEAYVACEAINEGYNTAKKEFERMVNQLVQYTK